MEKIGDVYRPIYVDYVKVGMSLQILMGLVMIFALSLCSHFKWQK